MEKPKRILAACDDSPQAAYVATYAASLASVMATQLVLARIIPGRHVESVRQAFIHFPDAPKDPNEAVSEYIREEERNAHNELGRLLSRHYRGLKVKTVVRVGVPHEVLLDVVAEKRIDMVVVGVSKHYLLLDRMMGSTVSHLFRRCPVPLVCARQTGAHAMTHQVDEVTTGVHSLNKVLAFQKMDWDSVGFQRHSISFGNEYFYRRR